MARISPKSRIYRTKEIMCHDVAEVLASTTLHHGTKHSVIDHVIWVWSEFEGKYEGCHFWSEEAIKLPQKATGLIHEHLVPRKIIRQKLHELKKPTSESVKHILETYCVGVVITKKEDDKLNSKGLRSAMPKGWNGRDVWARYTEAEIKIASKPPTPSDAQKSCKMNDFGKKL